MGKLEIKFRSRSVGVILRKHGFVVSTEDISLSSDAKKAQDPCFVCNARYEKKSQGIAEKKKIKALVDTLDGAPEVSYVYID